MSDRRCEGRVALVTGASAGGTGTAIAIRLAAEGAKVAITARNVEGLEQTRQRIEAIGGECVVLPADLADPSGDRSTLVPRAEAELGPLDILVNDAFVSGIVPFDELSAEELGRTFQVNLLAPWELMKAAVPGMRETWSRLGLEPPLPVLLASLQVLRDKRMADARDDIPTRHSDLARSRSVAPLG